MRNVLGFALLATFLWASQAFGASWSFNLGYHNPVFNRYGLNFLRSGDRFGFEIGIGALNLEGQDSETKDTNEEDETSLDLSGAANLKWFLRPSGIRPYLQGGMGVGLGGKLGGKSGASANTQEWFGGVGLLLEASSWYLYGSYNLTQSDQKVAQAGLGFML